MERVVVVHQPDFLPYLGFFHRLYLCDVFVVLDHVQLLKRGWHHRDRIKTEGGAAWLTVSLVGQSGRQSINEARISYEHGWVDKHLNLLRRAYSKAPFFGEVIALLEEEYARRPEYLVDLNMALITRFMQYFSIEVETVRSSGLNLTTRATELIIDTVQAVGGTQYLSGVGARDYLQEEEFPQRGIALQWQEFHHPEYPQLHGAFEPYLSCLDFAMNCGPHLREALFPKQGAA